MDEEDYYEDDAPLSRGHLSVDETPDDDKTKAVFWVPDPEQRRGWREVYIRRDKAKKAPKPFGFRPNMKKRGA